MPPWESPGKTPPPPPAQIRTEQSATGLTHTHTSLQALRPRQTQWVPEEKPSLTRNQTDTFIDQQQTFSFTWRVLVYYKSLQRKFKRPPHPRLQRGKRRCVCLTSLLCLLEKWEEPSVLRWALFLLRASITSWVLNSSRWMCTCFWLGGSVCTRTHRYKHAHTRANEMNSYTERL